MLVNNNFKLCFNFKKNGAGSLARIGHEPPKYTSLDWNGFREYLNQKYNEQWADACYRYARKYAHLISKPAMLETFSKYKKNNVLKSLIALSKYHGFYLQFRNTIKDYGIKWSQSSSVDSFFRIIESQDSDILRWYNNVVKLLDRDSSTFLEFVLLSGIRRTEALNSFNLAISLHRNRKLNKYYNEELETLEHFRFRDLFLRNTKNVFISMIPRDFIMEVVQHNSVTYDMVRKKLYRRHIPTRINELRDYYATFMVRHGLIKEEVDLLQGRIGKSIFVRHYWSPAMKELKDRVFKALKELEHRIQAVQ